MILRVLPVVALCLAVSAFGSRIVGQPPILLADAPAPSAGFTIDWQSVFGTMGVTGVLVWYLYYTTAVAFPRIRQDFKTEMSDERKHHEELSKEATSRVDRVCEELSQLSKQLMIRPCIMGKEKA